MTKKNNEKTQEEIDAENEAKAEQERIAEENRKLLEEQRKLASEAREKAAKAEGMLEAVKTFQQTQAANGGKREWSEEEWEAFKEKTGISREALAAIDGAVNTRLNDANAKFEERVRQAEERAKAAEERLDTSEKARSFERQKRSYIEKRPQYKGYEKDFDEFLSDYPEDVKRDPEKLEKILIKAETYVRGKVGSKDMRKTNGGSARFGNGDDGTTEDEEEVDLSDLRSHERNTIEKILPTKERSELLKANRHDMKGDSGVMFNTKSEWDMYKK